MLASDTFPHVFVVSKMTVLTIDTEEFRRDKNEFRLLVNINRNVDGTMFCVEIQLGMSLRAHHVSH